MTKRPPFIGWAPFVGYSERMDASENHSEPLNTDIGAVHFAGVLKTADNVIHVNGPLPLGEGVIYANGPLRIG